MRIVQTAIWPLVATGLMAQGSAQGFNWAGFQAGSLSLDSMENAKSAPFFGARGGLVFDEQHYGLSFDGFLVRPKSNIAPDLSLSHSEVSVNLLTGLSGDASSQFWPYLGLGLGGISVPVVSSTTPHVVTNSKGGTANLSFGVLHRVSDSLIWGAEARYLFAFTPMDLKELQGSLMVGFTWGGSQQTHRPSPPPPVVEAPPPPPEVKAEPRPAPTVPPPAPRPLATVPPPAPRPLAAPAPAPVPPPPPVVVAPPPVKVVPAPVVAAPAPRPAPLPAPATSTLIQRLDALRLGEAAKSVELGRKHAKAIPAHHWSVRLVIANLPSTLKAGAEAFPGKDPDLYVVPIKLSGGKSAYQLFLGDYATKADAERAIRTLPRHFTEGGNRPKAFLVGEIPN